MQFNIIDAIVVILIVLSFIVGLIGKTKKRVINFVTTFLAVATSYLSLDYVYSKLATIKVLGENLSSVVGVKMMFIIGWFSSVDGENLTIIADQMFKILVFFVLTLILFGIFGCIGKLFKLNSKDKKGKSFISRLVGAIANGLKTTIKVSVLFLLPLMIFAPGIKGVASIDENEESEKTNGLLTIVAEQIDNSKVIEIMGKVFSLEGNKVFEYTDANGEVKNIYFELNNVQ